MLSLNSKDDAKDSSNDDSTSYLSAMSNQSNNVDGDPSILIEGIKALDLDGDRRLAAIIGEDSSTLVESLDDESIQFIRKKNKDGIKKKGFVLIDDDSDDSIIDENFDEVVEKKRLVLSVSSDTSTVEEEENDDDDNNNDCDVSTDSDVDFISDDDSDVDSDSDSYSDSDSDANSDVDAYVDKNALKKAQNCKKAISLIFSDSDSTNDSHSDYESKSNSNSNTNIGSDSDSDNGRHNDSYRDADNPNECDVLHNMLYDTKTISSLKVSPTDEKERKLSRKARKPRLNPSSSLSSSDVHGKNNSEDNTWCKNKNGEYFLSGRSHIAGDVRWPKVIIPSKLYKKLYPHQRMGVQWMCSLFHSKTFCGGVLGDDMGLGKTLQTLTVIGGLMRSRSIRNALVVCPLSVVQNWQREARAALQECCVPSVTIQIVDSSIAKNRRSVYLENALSCSCDRPQLVITTYGLVKANVESYTGISNQEYWDYVILDEGHLIKNSSTQQHKSCNKIAHNPKTRRLLLTGTPIQNNMKELYALFDWATSGKLLGTVHRFLNTYAIPIENGRDKNATEWTLKTAEKANQNLQILLRPHFLQRMKNSEFKEELPTKKELVVWTRLSTKQRKLYADYLKDGGKVSEIILGAITSPLEALSWLKKLCAHPCLVDQSTSYNTNSLSEDSGKLQILQFLVERLIKSGHRILIFSQSTKMLDIIASVASFNFARIDGSTKGKDRQLLVDRFNQKYSKLNVMLLSTKAAGIGLNLIGASRVIIYDPSWNPADDSQAVDRCFRIGQKRDVTVYRFITAGTVEERMYEKQVQKDGIRRTVMTKSGCATERHFSNVDLHRLFQLLPDKVCEMLDKIKANTSFGPVGCSGKRSILETHPQVVGVSSHDAVYNATVVDLSNVEKLPFAGTPAGKTRSSIEKSVPVVSCIDLLQKNASPVMNIISITDMREQAKPLGRRKGTYNLQTIEHIRSSEITKEKIVNEDKINLSDILKKVDEMTKQMKIQASLDLLFSLLDVNELRGDEKITIHKKISARVTYLGWLQE